MSKIVWIIVGIFVGGFILLQLVPYGRDHSNPAIAAEPAWDSPETKALAQRACFDCHSNETVWPWYSHIAPVSWMVQNHVDEGREYLNFSEWGSGREAEEGEEMAESIYDGEMPVRSFLITHPEARLTEEEKQVLARGLMATAGGEGEHEGGESAEHEEDRHEEEHEEDEHEEGEHEEDD